MASTMAPYGAWVSPLGAATSRPPVAPGGGRRGRRRHLLAGRPAHRGRAQRARQAQRRRPDRRRHAARHERAHARPRVWWRRVRGRRWRRVLSRTSAISASTARAPAFDTLGRPELVAGGLQRGFRAKPITPPGQFSTPTSPSIGNGSGSSAFARTTPVRGEPVNTLVSVCRSPASPAPARSSLSGYDFYSTPRLSPDGSTLAWLSWRHPQMPWDGTELWVADVTPAGTLADARRVAGSASESIYQPGWSPDGVLYFVSDRSGWWKLYP